MPSGLGELSLKAYANIVGEDFKGHQDKFQTWAGTEVPRRPRFGSDPVKSGHDVDIAETALITHRVN